MSSKTPLFDDIRRQMEQITEKDVEFAIANSVFLERREVLLGIGLGHKLENLHEAARAFVLMAHLSQQQQEIVDGKMTLPQEVDEEGWVQALDIKIQMCELLHALSICALLMQRGMTIPENSTYGVVYYEGQFQATSLPREGVDSDDEEQDVIDSSAQTQKSLPN